jgi:hypothetical protein
MTLLKQINNKHFEKINFITFSVVPLLFSYLVSTIIENLGKNEH